MPHVPINFTAPAVSSAAMRAALANISRVQVVRATAQAFQREGGGGGVTRSADPSLEQHSVQGRAFKHRMGYTALLLLVRLTVSQGECGLGPLGGGG